MISCSGDWDRQVRFGSKDLAFFIYLTAVNIFNSNKLCFGAEGLNLL